MSERKAQDLDVLGETHLPDDLFTDTDGLNWMLDTYPDLGKGMGVLDHEVLGDPKSPPTLPDGVVVQAFEDEDLGEDQIIFGSLGDISGMTHEAGLTDLSWLELAEQDPERLPDNPVDNGIRELEEAWGVRRRTDGFALQPSIDREAAAYEASLKDTGAPKGASRGVVSHVVHHAWRQVTAGVPFGVAAREAAARLGHDAHQAKAAMSRIKDDAGLVGRVFVRASNYPGCASGTWTESVRKQAAGARYVVQKKACGDCVHAQNGGCSVFKKTLVASVPWDDALRRYTPLIEASGRKLASNVEPKEALRRAFAQVPRGMATVGDVRPTHAVAADQVGADEARQAFAAAPMPETKVLGSDRPSVYGAIPREKALAHVAQWRASGTLNRADAMRLASSGASGDDILRAAVRLISAAKRGAYAGQGVRASAPEVDREAAWEALAASEARLRQTEASIASEVDRRTHAASREGRREAGIRAKVAKVVSAIERGLRGQPLANFIRKVIAADEVAEVSKALDPVLRRTGALTEAAEAPRAYQGAQYERAATEAPRVASGAAHGEAARLIRWARQQMSEGFVGRDLDHLLENRFATSVRTAATSVLQALRSEHEGLAGHLYVDASAYATVVGTTGCEKGALRHRANQIPMVLQMDRCASCSLRVAKADGTPVCSVYNKAIVASVSEATGDPRAYQAEMIRLANGTDADRVAAMFSNAYDPDEFQLGQDGELDNLRLADTPPDEEVGEFLFGGMEIE